MEESSIGNEIRDKPPLMLLGQLADHNKLIPEFKVLAESTLNSVANGKLVTVNLTLGDELWTGEGLSIKKAKHDAAAQAWLNTKYSKPTKPKKIFNAASLTPTVKLNSLALSAGKTVQYTLINKRQISDKVFNNANQTPFLKFDLNSNLNNLYITNKSTHNYYNKKWEYTFRVDIDDMSYYGKGGSQQKARHSAAEEALKFIQDICPPSSEEKQCVVPEPKNFKSVITLAYEQANALKLNLTFQIKSVEGPPHLPEFTVKALLHKKDDLDIVELSALGIGNSKHAAKITAANAILQKMPKPLTDTKKKREKHSFGETKRKIKVCSSDGEKLHPVSRLIQIMHAKKMAEPVFTVLRSEKNSERSWIFIMECKVGDMIVTGTGSSKKLAKLSASEAMLSLLGYGVKLTNVNTQSKPMSKVNIKNKAIEKTKLEPVLEEEELL